MKYLKTTYLEVKLQKLKGKEQSINQWERVFLGTKKKRKLLKKETPDKFYFKYQNIDTDLVNQLQTNLLGPEQNTISKYDVKGKKMVKEIFCFLELKTCVRENGRLDRNVKLLAIFRRCRHTLRPMAEFGATYITKTSKGFWKS